MNITKEQEGIEPTHTLQIKALSINNAFKGRRFKTPEYNKYQKDVLMMLPNIKLGKAPYELNLIFGLSNSANDADNGVKVFCDCLVKKYSKQGFDDRMIYYLTIEKKIVKKGQEFINFKLTSIK